MLTGDPKSSSGGVWAPASAPGMEGRLRPRESKAMPRVAQWEWAAGPGWVCTLVVPSALLGPVPTPPCLACGALAARVEAPTLDEVQWPPRGHVGDRDGPGQQPAGQRLPDLQASVPPLEAQSPATSRVTSEPPLSGTGQPSGGGTEPGLPGVTSGLTTPGGRRGLEPHRLQEGLPDADVRAPSSLVSRRPGPEHGRGLRAASGRAQDGGAGGDQGRQDREVLPCDRGCTPSPAQPSPGACRAFRAPLHPPRPGTQQALNAPG